MPNSSFTYGQLQRLLLDLGFEDKSVPDSHAAFRHEDSDTVILLAIHSPDEPASLVDVRSVRRMLIEKGLIDPDEFDHRVAEPHLPSPPAVRSRAK